MTAFQGDAFQGDAFQALPNVQTLTPTGIASAEAFGSGTVKGLNTLAPGAIASSELFGSPTALPGSVTLLPVGLASAEAFGNPDLTKRFIKPKSIDLEAIVTSPTFTRVSVAYKKDGTEVASGVPRFEDSPFGRALMIEEGTTNRIENAFFAVGFDIATGWTGYGGPSGAVNERYQEPGWGGWRQRRRIVGTPTDSAAGVRKTGIPITGGQQETVSARVKTNKSAEGVRFIWRDDTVGQASSFRSSPVVFPPANEWVEITDTTSWPAGATVGSIYVVMQRGAAWVVDDYIDVAYVQLETKPYRTTPTGLLVATGTATRADEDNTVPALLSNPAQGTIEMRLFIPPASSHVNFARLFEARKTGTQALFSLGRRTNASINFTFLDEAGAGFTSTTVPNPGEGWRSIAVTWEAAVAKVFTDGVEVFSQANPGIASSYSHLGIGRRPATTPVAYLNTLFDDFRVSDRPLTPQEILDNYLASVA